MGEGVTPGEREAGYEGNFGYVQAGTYSGYLHCSHSLYVPQEFSLIY